MDIEKIEGYVRCLLESWALHEDGEERVVWETLHDLLMAVSRYELMSAAEKDMTTKLCKKLQYHFETNFSLKERKRKAKKENFPPNPLLKEKQTKEIEENNTHTVCDADSGFDEDLLKRYEVFAKKCEKYVGKYGRDMIDNFVRYWTLPNQATSKMKFEEETYWSLISKLESWKNSSFTKNDAAASMRLSKTRGKQQKVSDEESRRKQLAAEREEANARLERQRAESKAGAVTREEWLAMKAEREKTTDCTDYTNDEREEV